MKTHKNYTKKKLPFCSKKIVFLAGMLLLPMLVFAHPHVFIKTSCEFVFDENKLSGVWESWEFDRYFSADIIGWLDADANGTFSKEESNEVYNNAFINLKNYYFYTFIRQGTKRSNPGKVLHFSAHQKEGVMKYKFFIDLSEYKGNDLYFAVYDYTYFCDVQYIEPIKITTKNTSVTPSFSLQKNKDYPVYYDPMGAVNDTSVHYTWRKGLNTYYPQEIHISW